MITVCVPTRDRPAFLSRLLRYYANTGFRHRIVIGDSSARESAERNRRTVDAFSRELNVAYQPCPGLSSCSTVERLSQQVTTPYSALGADDDFLCPRGLEASAAVLEGHPDYSAAHGVGLLLQVEGDRPYGPVGTVRGYPQAVLGADTGAARLKEFFTVSLKSLIFSVHRTETWRDMFRGLGAMQGLMNHNVFKDELLPTCISVVRGKVHQVDGLYLVRQLHGGILRHPHVYDWLTDPSWFSSYEIFRDRVVDELMRQDGLTMERAQMAVREGFWPYLAHCVASDWQKDRAGRAPRPPSQLRALARRLPGARHAVRWVRARWQRRRDGFSCPALLDPRSPYHEDFTPIYQLITSAPRGTLGGGAVQDRLADAVMAGAGTHG